MSDDKQNMFIVTLFSFIPLGGKPKGEYNELMRGASVVEPDRLLKYTAAKFCVKELKDEGGIFYYELTLLGQMSNVKFSLEPGYINSLLL